LARVSYIGKECINKTSSFWMLCMSLIEKLNSQRKWATTGLYDSNKQLL